MILLITPQSRGPELASLVQANLSQETQWVQSVQEATTRLRERPYSAAIIDQFLLETEPEESDQMIEHLGTAYPVYINFAVTGLDRLVREVRSALHRRNREELAARRAVAEQMQSEMRETLTVMLLSCGSRCRCPMSRYSQQKRSAPSIRLRASLGCASKSIDPKPRQNSGFALLCPIFHSVNVSLLIHFCERGIAENLKHTGRIL